MTEPVSFGIVAGEKSGDILGAGLMEALRSHYPDARFVGVGGPQMIELGCQSLADMERLSVMGFVEPLGRLPELFALKSKLVHSFLAKPPLAFIGIDSPDFNLRLESDLHQHGINTVHYVSPSVWAYRAGRIHKIKRVVDLMLTLFPFETAIYEQHGVAVQSVGHPLADQIGFDDHRDSMRLQLGLPAQDPVLALLPGSRSSEIRRLAPVFFGAAMYALQHYPKLRFIIPASSAANRILLQDLLRSEGLIGDELFQIVDDSRAAMAAADIVLLASG
ncbi:MAG: lipid-A-disaccharide synthase, partial [Gammaproteobacteria bacterium]